MAGINKVILIGNLGADPEIRTLEGGTKVARIRIATSESYTNKQGQRVDQTEWHHITLWRHLAEICEKYVTKGKQVYIEGKLRTRTWKDQEGKDRYTTEIVADNLQLLGKVGDAGGDNRPKPNESYSTPQQAAPIQNTAPVKQQAFTPDADADDLPF